MPDPRGRFSTTSRANTRCCDTFCVSMSGADPLTVTVSCTSPTDRSALMFAVKPVVNSMPSRRTLPNPVSENVTE